jgi:hypothetical protein
LSQNSRRLVGNRGRQRGKLSVDPLQSSDQSVEAQSRNADLLHQARPLASLPLEPCLQAHPPFPSRQRPQLQSRFHHLAIDRGKPLEVAENLTSSLRDLRARLPLVRDHVSDVS